MGLKVTTLASFVSAYQLQHHLRLPSRARFLRSKIFPPDPRSPETPPATKKRNSQNPKNPEYFRKVLVWFRRKPCTFVVQTESFSAFWHFNVQKNPRVRKNFCLQFWGRKWVRQFYGHLEKCVLSAGETMSVKFPFFGGGFAGGGVPILFLWARGFF